MSAGGRRVSLGGSLLGPFVQQLHAAARVYAFTLWSDASGDSMSGYFLGPEVGSGVWWRFEFDDDVRARLREQVRGWNDLSINVFELLGMVVTAWIFVTQLNVRPSYARETMLMRGDNMAAVHRVSKWRGGEGAPVGGTHAFVGLSRSRQWMVF